MPLYDYECPTCGVFLDIWAGIDETDLQCGECHHPMTRLISATRINPDIEPYLEHNMGDNPVWIKSRQHYYEEMSARGLNNVSDIRGGRSREDV